MTVVRCAALALLVGLAGCGESVPLATEAAPRASVVPAPPQATFTPPAAVVTIDDFRYGPRVLRVAKGARVLWTNADFANHTVTFARGPGDLGNLDIGGTRSAHFTRAGTFTYVCVYHPSMRGKVVVR